MGFVRVHYALRSMNPPGHLVRRSGPLSLRDRCVWDEVKNSTRPEGFTVDTVPERLARLGSDPWTDIAKVRQSLSATVRRRVGI
jgi:DNA primase